MFGLSIAFLGHILENKIRFREKEDEKKVVIAVMITLLLLAIGLAVSITTTIKLNPGGSGEDDLATIDANLYLIIILLDGMITIPIIALITANSRLELHKPFMIMVYISLFIVLLPMIFLDKKDYSDHRPDTYKDSPQYIQDEYDYFKEHPEKLYGD